MCCACRQQYIGNNFFSSTNVTCIPTDVVSILCLVVYFEEFTKNQSVKKRKCLEADLDLSPLGKDRKPKPGELEGPIAACPDGLGGELTAAWEHDSVSSGLLRAEHGPVVLSAPAALVAERKLFVTRVEEVEGPMATRTSGSEGKRAAACAENESVLSGQRAERLLSFRRWKVNIPSSTNYPPADSRNDVGSTKSKIGACDAKFLFDSLRYQP